MKKLFMLIFFVSLTLCLYSQESETKRETFQFTVVKELPITPIKNQNRSSTCWSFSALSFLESELIRMKRGEFDLSEMFIVSASYTDKVDKYVRTGGNINMAPGSSFGDVLHVIRDYGLVPESAMNGLNYGETNHVHNELDALVSSYARTIAKNPNGIYSKAWKNGLQGILNSYLGERPTTFEYNGKSYNPKSFAKELELNPDDYISLTSFTHHPFYTQFAIEIPDNWRWDTAYNIPIDEFMQVFDYAIENGYTVCWGADVSEKGFTRNGVAIVPESNIENISGSDQAKWIGLSPDQLKAKISAQDEIVPEKNITQEERQIAFDNGQTTDDHGMLIFGIAKDQKGNKYYMVKNSWGTANKYNGIWYASERYVKYKTINIVVHKNSIPTEIKAKLNIK